METEVINAKVNTNIGEVSKDAASGIVFLLNKHLKYFKKYLDKTKK
jgi:hypothetical protein